jgi:hypothetical protein
MPFIEAPVMLDGNPHEIHFIEHDPEGTDRPLKNGSESDIKGISLSLEKPPCVARFLNAPFREIYIDPAGEKIFPVPDALSVSEQNQCVHDDHPLSHLNYFKKSIAVFSFFVLLLLS